MEAAKAAASCYVKQPNPRLFGILSGLVKGQVGAGDKDPLGEVIGRLTYESERDLRTAEDTLLSLLAGTSPTAAEPAAIVDTSSLDGIVGVLTGLESLERRHASLAGPSPAVVELATRVVDVGARQGHVPEAREEGALARRLAFQVLLTGRAVTPALADVALADPDSQVRRLAALAAAREEPLRPEVLKRALRDRSGLVRYAALSQLGRRRDATVGAYCDTLLDLTRDEDPHVALLAIDLAARCTGSDRAIATIAGEVDQWAPEVVPPQGGRPRWHRAAHGLVSLAILAPGRAAPAIARLAGDQIWQVRMYSARAAGLTGQLETLRRLARDPNDNVREAAIASLTPRAGHEADALYLEALARDDYQLLITAARALEGTPRRADALSAVRAALDRVTRQQRETSRDARLALLERLGELGEASDTARLRPYLSDFDPVIARQAASVLTKGTGQPHVATPTPLPRLQLPTPEQLSRLLDTRVVLHMRGLGRVELRLLASDAPLNAFRFVRLAAEGYYDGLTFHRVVPGFVIQGGSPGANEYTGDGPFTRDEIGAPNRRGSIGLSTRGRDTGDAQFYVNLVDNYRLDEEYTVFAEVVGGMDLVDRILEGDVIDRADVVRP
jgi:cyclophilin family peptidyl-prolyl cis-trans isomerase/HEAT repeat protein